MVEGGNIDTQDFEWTTPYTVGSVHVWDPYTFPLPSSLGAFTAKVVPDPEASVAGGVRSPNSEVDRCLLTFLPVKGLVLGVTLVNNVS